MQTKFFNRDDVAKTWWIVDASGKNLGRLSTKIANMIRGKHKPSFSPNADTGDFVVVINAEKIEMTGNKWSEKKYYNHTGYFGSLNEANAAVVREKNPTKLIEQAVEGMLPKNKLSYGQIKHLKIYAGSEHPHKAQNPQALDV